MGSILFRLTCAMAFVHFIIEASPSILWTLLTAFLSIDLGNGQSGLEAAFKVEIKKTIRDKRQKVVGMFL